uniref:Uncharacterized protein n=1 Tax=Rhizophora mucronata TaxID=61149 RepID=A0A2P2LWM7_RHIMU
MNLFRIYTGFRRICLTLY